MSSQRPKLLIFDVNETLLDLTPLKDKINMLLGKPYAFDLWFQTLLHYSLVESLTLNFVGFGKIGMACLEMVAEKFKVPLNKTEATLVLGTMKTLPSHIDVIPGLTQLKTLGYTMVALTNGTKEAAIQQLEYAKLSHFFTTIFSVESVQTYKPHASTYAHVLETMHVQPEEAMLIAAHAWDTLGAKRAGLTSAFIHRAGKSLYPLAKKPDLYGKTIEDIAKKLMLL